ncbi:MAG TPA: amidohydrolase family protein, partial [Burkholderiales bacterium]
MALILPPHATDCHMHVLGPFDRYPLAAERAYNVPEASLEEHERMKRRTGLERTVFVQASGHGFDNRAMLAALAELGERARGIAVLPLATERNLLVEMQRQGVRGLRLNLLTLASRHGGEPRQLIKDYGRKLSPLGWHLQIFAAAATYLDLEEAIGQCAVPVVIDHMGLPDAAQGVEQPGFQAVLRLAKLKHIWVKLAGADR